MIRQDANLSAAATALRDQKSRAGEPCHSQNSRKRSQRPRGISIEELRKQLTLGEINVTRAQVEEAYKQNASFFASMSPDEAREGCVSIWRTQARMKHYRAGSSAAEEVDR